MTNIILGVLFGFWILSFGFPVYAAFTEDITHTGVGARAMAMGKAYSALSDEPFGIFTNAAGLSRIDCLQVGTMQTSLMGGEVNYLSFGLVQPSKWGNIGLGYVNSSVGGIPVVTMSGGRPVQSGTINASDSVLALSYAAPFAPFGRMAFEDLSFGSTLKYFSKNLGTSRANASGWSVDMGLKYHSPRLEWLSLGLAAQNLVATPLKWETGEEEVIPTLLKVGTTFNWSRLTLSADVEMRPNQLSYPARLVVGTEWKPVELLALRAGADAASLTMGVGFAYRGFAFDYAYRRDAVVAENSAHYFSLSFLGEEKIVAPAAAPPEETSVFPDLPADYWDREAINTLATMEVIEGRPDGKFYPDSFTTRSDLVAFTLKLMQKTDNCSLEALSSRMGFLSATHWFSKYAAMAIKTDMKAIYKDWQNFRPKYASRFDTVLVLGKLCGIDKEKHSLISYADIAPTGRYAGLIAAAKENGWLDFISGNKFEAERPITRAETAFILYQIIGKKPIL